jgi:hypothetical protein
MFPPGSTLERECQGLFLLTSCVSKEALSSTALLKLCAESSHHTSNIAFISYYSSCVSSFYIHLKHKFTRFRQLIQSSSLKPIITSIHLRKTTFMSSVRTDRFHSWMELSTTSRRSRTAMEYASDLSTNFAAASGFLGVTFRAQSCAVQDL